MRLRAIGEWQYVCSSWATAVLRTKGMGIRPIGERQHVSMYEKNKNKSNRRMAVYESQLGHKKN